MFNMNDQEIHTILDLIQRDFNDLVNKFDSRKYPEEQYKNYLSIFREPDKVTKLDIQNALIWKYGHWGKENYPESHKEVINKVQSSWRQFTLQPSYDPKAIFDFWTNVLQNKTNNAFITVCFLIHLVLSDKVPMIDQHAYRAMNFLVKTVREDWSNKTKPSQYKDISLYQEFFYLVYTYWFNQGNAPTLRAFDKYLMMFGKHIKQKTPRSRRVVQRKLDKNKIPTFREVYDCLQSSGPARVISSHETQYTVKSRLVRDKKAIIAFPQKGRITIHEDCWGLPKTCQGTRAGGIYNGPYSIFNWYADHNKN